MKFKIIFISLLVFSCSSMSTSKYERKTFNSKGFAYIYDLKDYDNKIIKKKIITNEPVIAHHSVRRGALIKIINPENKKSLILKNQYKVDFPNFYNILINDAVVKKLDLNQDIPYVEIQEVRKNKSFIAKRAEIHDEEKQIHDSAPIEKVSISNLSKKKVNKPSTKKKFIIILGNFYSLDSAKNLVNRIKTDSYELRNKKISIFKKNEHNYEVFLGPYNTIKKIKNDYIALNKINFDEVDIELYD